jgi:hypothetical protein
MRYAIYKTTTGDISRVVDIHSTTNVDEAYQATIQCEQDESYIQASETCQDDTHYIDVTTTQETVKATNPTTVDKTTFNANGVDTVTFSNIPEGSEVFVEFASQGVTDASDSGVFEYSSDLVGSHAIRISHTHYLDYEVLLNAS